jgi:hypothetical protein
MTSPSNQSAGSPVGAASKGTSVWEDFVDIFHSPSDVFARRQNGNFWIPLLVVTVVIGVLFIAVRGLMQPIMDAEFQRGVAVAMRNNPQMTEDQIATMRGLQDKLTLFAPFIVIPITIFLTGFALWLVGKLFDAAETFRTALIVTAYAFVPKILEIILGAIQALLMNPSSLTGRYSITLGLGRFLNPDTSPPYLLALLGRVDVFTIWVTVLLAIGLSVTGRIPRSRAALAAACVWLIGAIPALLGALRS